VDVDPQGNASSALGREAPDGGDTYEVLLGDVPLAEAVLETTAPGVRLLPASRDLAGAEIELVAVEDREQRLRRALAGVRDAYDYVLMDCPPSLGLLTVNALAAADEVIIPVQAEYFALEGLSHLSHTIELVRRNLNPKLLLRGVLLTMFDGRTNLAREVEAEVRRHFANTFHAVIPRSVRLAEAPSHGEPIATFDPTSPGAKAYDDLADELIAALRARDLLPPASPSNIEAPSARTEPVAAASAPASYYPPPIGSSSTSETAHGA
jgi:chromosome partitioning protein